MNIETLTLAQIDEIIMRIENLLLLIKEKGESPNGSN